jgi:hypothetical protein
VKTENELALVEPGKWHWAGCSAVESKSEVDLANNRNQLQILLQTELLFVSQSQLYASKERENFGEKHHWQERWVD